MQNGNFPTTLRRSSRVPAAVSILVTSLEGKHFSEVCETLVVNAHGCSLMSRVKVDAGIPVHFHSKEGRETTAQVVSCQPIGSDNRTWRLGAKLDKPENFWGLRDCPKDWAMPASATTSKRLMQVLSPATSIASHKSPAPMTPPAEAMLDGLAQRLEAQVTRMIADSVAPLQAEIIALKEKLARRGENRSNFEVSLSSIPPELEQQLELRLKKDLGPRMLDEQRQQCSQLLSAAKTTIDERTTQGYEDFLRRVAKELQVVEQRAQEISSHISQNAREYLNHGLEDFHQRLVEGGNSLKRLSEELLTFLQQNLNAECDMRREDLERLRAIVASESSRLHDHIEYIDVRIRKLEESAHSLESGLDQRLSQMSSNTVRETRDQLDGAVNDILEQLSTRGAKVLSDQLDETSANMKIVQKGIIASSSDSLKAEAAIALQAFEHSMQELAKASVERLRLQLASGLNVLVKNLGEQLQSEAQAASHVRPD
jgi:hypothetical protein